jgi:hypothetical protein
VNGDDTKRHKIIVSDEDEKSTGPPATFDEKRCLLCLEKYVFLYGIITKEYAGALIRWVL